MGIYTRRDGTPCTVEGCENPIRTDGLCLGHYTRRRRGLDVNAPLKTRNAGKECSTPGCHSPAYAWGMCRPHYRRAAYLKTGT